MDNKIPESVKIETPEVAKEENDVKPIKHAKEKKNMKEERARKKDDKSVEQVLKSLNNLETAEEKLAAMCKKYSELVDENRKLQLALKQSERKTAIIQREKEQFQSEHSKAVLTRSRLESLCRELQRQNKAVKDESLLKMREEEEKRKELSAKFQSTLTELNTLISQNNEKTAVLYETNMETSKRFKTMCEQYKLREQQVMKTQQQLHLEAQLAKAKLAKAKLEMTEEKEILLKEKQQLLLNLTEYQVQIRELQATEVGLRSQISMYTDKYDEFQNALTKNNDVFGGFKEEMEKMSKKILKLEKETSSWKQRWENSHAALLEMAADKQQGDAELATTNRKLAQLQQLCRALQGERTSLLAQLRSKDGALEAEANERIVIEENIKSIKQVDDLSKNCEQLKENLVQLQGSLVEAMKKEAEETKQQEAEETEQNETEETNQQVAEGTKQQEPKEAKDAESHAGKKSKAEVATVVAEEPEEKSEIDTVTDKPSEQPCTEVAVQKSDEPTEETPETTTKVEQTNVKSTSNEPTAKVSEKPIEAATEIPRSEDVPVITEEENKHDEASVRSEEVIQDSEISESTASDPAPIKEENVVC